MSYTKPFTLDNTPGGDSVNEAITIKLDGNATQVVADLNTHEALTTTHGSSGAILGASVLSTTTTLGTSNSVVPTQNAVKTYVDTNAVFASGTKLVFYQDAAPTGWTLLNTLDDKILYITKGSVAGGQTGGGEHSSGTWTQPSHGHTFTGDATGSAGTGATSTETPTTSAAGTGATGAEGTGATGAEGTGATGASSGNTGTGSSHAHVTFSTGSVNHVHTDPQTTITLNATNYYVSSTYSTPCTSLVGITYSASDGAHNTGDAAYTTSVAWTQAESAHTHSLNSHTHTGPSHTHTGPSHTHTGPSHTHTAAHSHTGPAHTHTVSGSNATSATAATWRPAAYCAIICSKT